jgi:hypothetical protein
LSPRKKRRSGNHERERRDPQGASPFAEDHNARCNRQRIRQQRRQPDCRHRSSALEAKLKADEC